MTKKAQAEAAAMASALLEAEPTAGATPGAQGRYSGPTLSVLRKYRLADETGNIRAVKLDQDKDPAPMVDPEIIDKFLNLDPSKNKRLFDWMLYAAGGGQPKIVESQRALELAKTWVLDNRMKGKGRNDEDVKVSVRNGSKDLQIVEGDIARDKVFRAFTVTNSEEIYSVRAFDDAKIQLATPYKGPSGTVDGTLHEAEKIQRMSRQEAEADWAANDEPRYHDSYFFADQDLASDVQYPVFGYFRNWPGRDSVYAKVVDGVDKWKGLVANKKLISEFNKLSPAKPFHTDMWVGEEPRYKSADELMSTVSTFKATLARHKAERNIQFIGRPQTPQGGEGAVGPRATPAFTRGPNEVLYRDEITTVYIPATAAASLKAGFMDWCVANKTRWNSYFQTQSRDDLYWGTYNAKGPFIYWHFVKNTDPYLAKLAGHIQLACKRNGGAFVSGIEFWDTDNKAKKSYEEIATRLERALPGSKKSFDASLQAAKEWFDQFKEADIERFPSLEAMAQKLVKSLLEN